MTLTKARAADAGLRSSLAGLYMKDLFFMNDGNQTFIGRELVNFQKFRTIMAKILALRVSQQSHYDFQFPEGAHPPCASRKRRWAGDGSSPSWPSASRPCPRPLPRPSPLSLPLPCSWPRPLLMARRRPLGPPSHLEIGYFCEVLYAKEEDVLTEESHILEPPKFRRQLSAASFSSQLSESTANSDEYNPTLTPASAEAPPAGPA